MKIPVSDLTDNDLRSELTSFGFSVGPITGTTRKLLEKKLRGFRDEGSSVSSSSRSAKSSPSPASRKKQIKPVETSTIPATNSGGGERRTSTRKSISTTLDSLSFSDSPKDDSLDSLRSRSTTSNIRSKISTSINKPFLNDSTLSFGFDDSAESSRIISPPQSNRYQPAAFSGGVKPTAKGSPVGTRFGGGVWGSSSTSNRINTQGNTSSGTLSFGQGDDLEDDHMESSRILSPSSRFRPSPIKKQPAGKGSPMEQITNFGRTAWGYFSRPIGQSTPCSDDAYKKPVYGADYSPRNVQYSPIQKYGRRSYVEPKKGFSLDISRWMVVSFMMLILVLLIGYTASSHPEAVKHWASAIFDATKATVNFLYSYAVLPSVGLVLVALIVVGAYQGYKFYENKKTEFNKRLMALVERITDIIHDNKDGIAEPHVRDMLMPPTKRTEEDFKLWNKAAEFINTEDSRIRTEIRLINGIECNVWIWVTPNKQMWQGTAVVEGSPSANLPANALTKCLKLRGLNFSNDNFEKAQLRLTLVEKVAPIVPVHVGFTNGIESVVYMKLKSLKDANKAFTSLHSNWFNGCLLTAKYVHDKRYDERFPEAVE